MSIENILDLTGTSETSFTLGPIGSGTRIKNSSGNLLVRNNADSADASLTTSQLLNSGNSLVLNSDAAGSGADWLLTVARPSSGMTAAWTLTLPTTAGSASQVLQTDGSGNTSWVTVSTSSSVTVDTTTLSFGDSSPVTMFTLPANAVVSEIAVIIDTAFDGTAPTVSVGIGGNTSKFMSSSANNLKSTAGSVDVASKCRGVATSGSTQAIIATYAADSSAAGSARIQVSYFIPA